MTATHDPLGMTPRSPEHDATSRDLWHRLAASLHAGDDLPCRCVTDRFSGQVDQCAACEVRAEIEGAA